MKKIDYRDLPGGLWRWQNMRWGENNGLLKKTNIDYRVFNTISNGLYYQLGGTGSIFNPARRIREDLEERYKEE